MSSPHVLTRTSRKVDGNGRSSNDNGRYIAHDSDSDYKDPPSLLSPPSAGARLTRAHSPRSQSSTPRTPMSPARSPAFPSSSSSPQPPTSPATISARRNIRSQPAPLKLPKTLPPNLSLVTPPHSANSLLSPKSAAAHATQPRLSPSSAPSLISPPVSASGSGSSPFPSPARSTSSSSPSGRRGSGGVTGLGTARPFATRPIAKSRTSGSGYSDSQGRQSSSLMPRSAVASNYFNLDFSFLEEDPPKSATGSTFSERRRSSGGSSGCFPGAERRPSGSTDLSLKRRESYMSNGSTDILAYASRSPMRASFVSLQKDTLRSTMPFPSKRPSNTRTISTDSITSASDHDLPSRPDRLLPSATIKDYRRPSVTSTVSAETNYSAASSDTAALGPDKSPKVTSTTPDGSPTSRHFPRAGLAHSPSSDDQQNEVVERRKRLATFLDATAAAMEGGRTLRQVLPETAPARGGAGPAKSLSELAEISASSPSLSGLSPLANRTPSFRPSSRASGRSSTQGDPMLPGAFDASPIPRVPRIPIEHESATSIDHRATLFFTPDAAADVASTLLPPNIPELEEDESRFVKEPLGTGLGLAQPAQNSVEQRSPATRNVLTPIASPRINQNALRHSGITLDGTPQTDRSSAYESEMQSDRELKAKLADKRRRTIQELIDTEQTYATDMRVVRDIYLARARGADFNSIADYVMGSGLGLSSAASPSSPSSTRKGFESPIFSSRSEQRRMTMASLTSNSSSREGRRISSAPSFSAKLEQRRATKARMSSVSSFSSIGAPLMTSKDLHVVFANLEEVAGLAERFAHLLGQAKGSSLSPGARDEMDDNVGEVFVNLIPQIQQIYSTYCARHHRAIVRLQELEPSLKTYLNECKTLSHGRTRAWDLASLLIKPVQRCLKYPLLLDQILAVTPENHPDRHDLVKANSEMLLVAEHINESKKRHEPLTRVGSISASAANRRESKSSLSSSMTKKFLRSSISSKSNKPAAISNEQAAERDDMFDTLAALVDSTRSSVLRFSSEMREWSKGTKAQLEAQVTVVEGWLDLYAPLSEEPDSQDSLYHRLMVFLEQVLDPTIDGPYREVEHEIRRSLLLKSDHLLSLFESPRQFIQKRNDKMLDHSRYLAKKLPADRRGSDEYLELSARLLEELPRFLASVSKYYDIIVGHFAGAQEAYQEEVQERWDAFTSRFPIRDVAAGGQQALANELMHRLAVGLGVSTPFSPSGPSSARKRLSRGSNTYSNGSLVRTHPLPRRESIMVVDGPLATSNASNPNAAGALNLRSQLQEYQLPNLIPNSSSSAGVSATNRSSVTSDSSTPSFTVSSKSGESSNGTPMTPPPFAPLPRRPSEDFYTKRRLSLHQRSSSNNLVPIDVTSPSSSGLVAPMTNPFASNVQAVPTKNQIRRDSGDDTSGSSSITAVRPLPPYRQVSSTSIVQIVPPKPEEESQDPEDYYYDDDKTLYVAEAMENFSSRSSVQGGGDGEVEFRGAFPVLDFKIGDRIHVEHEEADCLEGGCGWLLGRKDGEGELGWVRTEHFSMLDE